MNQKAIYNGTTTSPKGPTVQQQDNGGTPLAKVQSATGGAI